MTVIISHNKSELNAALTNIIKKKDIRIIEKIKNKANISN